MGKNVYIHTFGCQMNERDSEMVAAVLKKSGYAVVDSEKEADIIIVNTCSVREKAENKALGKLGLLTNRKNGKKIVGVMGCMSQRFQDKIFEILPNLDFAVGTASPASIPEIIEKVVNEGAPYFDFSCGTERDEYAHILDEGGRVSAFINILYGCNRQCSFCIVPKVRGKERSRMISDIVKEATMLLEGGVKEIVLLGQSVMSYGRTNLVMNALESYKYKEPLACLLEALDRLPFKKRLRFTSGHPDGCTEELSNVFAELPSVMPHLHLPMQSGSNRILNLMKRGYSAERFKDVVSMLRSKTPQLAFTTDIIVGFPTETEEDFEETRKMLYEIEFDNAFIFQYSPRPGTLAAEMNDDVPKEIKLKRNHILLEDINKIAKRRHIKRIGSVEEILVEGMSKRNKSKWCGRTRDNLMVVFDYKNNIKVGDFINVLIERAEALTLYGTIV